VNNFGVSGNNLTKRVHVVCREAGIKIWVQFLGEPAPLKFPGALFNGTALCFYVLFVLVMLR